MNIFVLDEDYRNAAQMHCDKHVVKMITESAQLLSTALRLNGFPVGYNLTHQNHPCAIWTRMSFDNFTWLKNLAYSLEKEWRYRFDHRNNEEHKAASIIREIAPYARKVIFPYQGLTEFHKCFPEYLRHLEVVPGYRQTYIFEKQHILTYTKREPPFWLPNELVTRK